MGEERAASEDRLKLVFVWTENGKTRRRTRYVKRRKDGSFPDWISFPVVPGTGASCTIYEVKA